MLSLKKKLQIFLIKKFLMEITSVIKSSRIFRKFVAIKTELYINRKHLYINKLISIRIWYFSVYSWMFTARTWKTFIFWFVLEPSCIEKCVHTKFVNMTFGELYRTPYIFIKFCNYFYIITASIKYFNFVVKYVNVNISIQNKKKIIFQTFISRNNRKSNTRQL